MREERGQIPGALVVFEPLTLWGSVGGDLTVVEGGKLYMRGSVYGNMRVEYGGRVHIYGNIAGNLTVERGAKVVHSGVVNGDATNNGGRLFVDASGKVNGKIRTTKGETSLHTPPVSIVRSPGRGEQ